MHSCGTKLNIRSGHSREVVVVALRARARVCVAVMMMMMLLTSSTPQLAALELISLTLCCCATRGFMHVLLFLLRLFVKIFATTSSYLSGGPTASSRVQVRTVQCCVIFVQFV